MCHLPPLPICRSPPAQRSAFNPARLPQPTPTLQHPFLSSLLSGAISSTPEERRRLARESLAYNIRSPVFRKLFPEWVAKAEAAAAAPPPQPPAQQQKQVQQQAEQQAGAQQAAQQQQGQQQGQAPAAHGAHAAGARAAGLAQAAGQQQQQQWSRYLMGAAAVAAAGVAATMLMKPADG